MDLTLDQIRHRLKEARALVDELKDAEHRAMLDEAGVAIDDIVRKKDDIGRVTEIKPNRHGRAFVVVNPQRADGSFGTARRRWFDEWELVNPPQVEMDDPDEEVEEPAEQEGEVEADA